MRRITTWILSTVSALVLLFSYHTSTSSGATASVTAQADTDPGSTGSTDTGGSSGSGSAPSAPETGGSSGSGSSPSAPGTGGSNGSGSSSSSAARTFTGDAVTTRFGDVQVRITVKDGRITASKVTRVPWTDHRDQEINSRAVPILNAEAVDAQAADIDMVSGATYTSRGYAESLQSAIDRADL